MGHPKTHTFNGKKYTIYLEPVDGLCDVPGTDELQLHIFSDLKTRTGLETCCHEALHACQVNKSEKVVTSIAKDLTRFLWRLGFRYVKQ